MEHLLEAACVPSRDRERGRERAHSVASQLRRLTCGFNYSRRATRRQAVCSFQLITAGRLLASEILVTAKKCRNPKGVACTREMKGLVLYFSLLLKLPLTRDTLVRSLKERGLVPPRCTASLVVETGFIFRRVNFFSFLFPRAIGQRMSRQRIFFILALNRIDPCKDGSALVRNSKDGTESLLSRFQRIRYLLEIYIYIYFLIISFSFV